MVTPSPRTPQAASHHDRQTLPVPSLLSEEEAIGRLLVEEGVLDAAQLEQALAEVRDLRARGQNDARISDVLIRRGWCRFDQISAVIRLRDQMRASAAHGVGRVGRPSFGPRDSSRASGTRPASSSGGSFRSVTPNPDDMPEEVKRALAEGRKAFGKYIVVAELGRGGMGVVYKAWDSVLGRDVAIKLLKAEGVDDQEAARFAREAQTAASLSHPNIVPVYELAETEGKLYIAMKFVAGKTPVSQKLPWREACAVTRTVARALDYAHRLGVVHRDIKPHNIIIDAEGVPHLMDFGLAKSLVSSSTLTSTGLVLGTPAYISPEQAYGEVEKVGPRSDIYSLGATLYELVTGEPPFIGKTPYHTMRRAVEEDPVSPSQLVPEIPRDLETIILKAMAKDRDARYPDAAALADDLDCVLRGEAIWARRSGAATRIARELRRNPGLTPAVVVASLLLGTGGFFGLRAAARASELRAYREQAAALFAEERWADARDVLERADALSPGDPAIVERIRDCDERLRAAAAERDAAEEMRREAEAQQRRQADAQPFVDAGRRLVEDASRDFYREGADLGRTRDQLDRAIVSLGQAIDLVPASADAWLWRARARAALFDREGAIEDLGRAIEADPRSRAAHVERAELRLALETEALVHAGWQVGPQVEERLAAGRAAALDDLRRAEAIEVGDADPFIEALVAFADRRLDDCVAACDRALELRPSRAEAFKLRADARHFALGNFEDSVPRVRSQIEAIVADYDRALDLRANDYGALVMRGYELQALGDVDRARADYERALTIRPGDALGCWFLATWELKQLQRHAATGNLTNEQTQHHLRTALDLIDRGLAAEPESYVLRINRAMVLGNLRREGEALAEASRAMELNRDHYFGWYTKGSLEARLHEMENAVASLERSIELAPTFASSWSNLGLIHRSRGDVEPARRCLEKAIELGHPAPDRIQRVLDALDQGR